MSFSLSVILCLLVVTPMTAYGAEWYDSNWLKAKEITIDSSQVDSSLTDFPLLVNMTDTDVSSAAQPDCDDILFTDNTNATKYSHEIENCDLTTNDWFTAWVKIPSVSSSVDTDIFMYYDNSGASSQEDVSGTWNSNYISVWHLHDDFLDSTSNSHDGTNNGSTNETDEYIADSQSLDGSGDYISVSDHNDFESIDSLSVSAWVYNDVSTADEPIVGKFDNPTPGWSWLLWRDDVAGVSGRTNTYSYIVNTASGLDRYEGNTNAASTSQWELVHGTWERNDANGMWIYVDGTQQTATESTQNNSVLATTTDVWLGRFDSGGSPIYRDGKLDEVRVMSNVLSQDWISAEYDNQKTGSTFLTIGNEGTEPITEPNTSIQQNGGWLFFINWLWSLI